MGVVMQRNKKTDKEVCDKIIGQILKKKSSDSRYEKIATILRERLFTENSLEFIDVIEELEMIIETCYFFVDVINKKNPQKKLSTVAGDKIITFTGGVQ